MNKYRVAELRKKKGWTQEVLSEKSKITVRTIQRIETGKDVSLDTLTSISNALLVPMSELFETIEEEEREVEIMEVSKEQITQIKYRKNLTSSITVLIVGAIFLIMSVLGVGIINLSAGNNIMISWLVWVSLLLFLIGLSIYYLGVKLNEKLDKKYPLTKGINFSDSDKEEKEPIENGWQFIARYWWIVFPIGGFLSWLIPYLIGR